MTASDLRAWQHEHRFDTGNQAAERGTRIVVAVTIAAMVGEIVAGWAFNSMALLADGLHMSSHALAIGLSAFAYAAARRLANDPRYAFGTWKIEILGGFASALFLLGVAALMLFGSIERLLSPDPIRYQEAIVVAVVGLAVNLVCALILGRVQHGGDGDHHGHGHGDGHSHGHGRGHAHAHHDHAHAGHAHADHAHADLNLRSAYMHVIADAATSVLAIAALVGGWIFGWAWLDPVMGIVGAVLVALWAKGLIADTGRILLDREMDHPVVDEIREVIAEHGASPRTEIADLHVWRVGRAAYACALSLVTDDPGLTPQRVRTWLAVHDEVVHTTIEIHQRTSAEA